MTYPPVLPIHSTAAVSSPRTVHFAEVVSGKQEGAVSNHSTLKVCHGAVQQTVLRSIPKTCYLYFFFFFFFIPFNDHENILSKRPNCMSDLSTNFWCLSLYYWACQVSLGKNGLVLTWGQLHVLHSSGFTKKKS
uniref:Uncharacterized protein n=1 Tax=Cacopsylla melanoneura TaxID=428564 RepID=A0A8D8XAV4_9HEMI